MGTGTGMRTLDNICGETSVLPTPTAVPQGAKAGWPVAGAMGDGQRGSTGRFGGGAVACSVLPLPVPRPSHPPLPSLLPPSATSHGRPGSLGSPPQPAPKNTVWFCLRGVPCPGRETSGLGACSCLRSLAPDGHSLAPLPHLLPQGSEPCPPPPPSSRVPEPPSPPLPQMLKHAYSLPLHPHSLPGPLGPRAPTPAPAPSSRGWWPAWPSPRPSPELGGGEVRPPRALGPCR